VHTETNKRTKCGNTNSTSFNAHKLPKQFHQKLHNLKWPPAIAVENVYVTFCSAYQVTNAPLKYWLGVLLNTHNEQLCNAVCVGRLRCGEWSVLIIVSWGRKWDVDDFTLRSQHSPKGAEESQNLCQSEQSHFPGFETGTFHITGLKKHVVSDQTLLSNG
jgi:hypothetical protein